MMDGSIFKWQREAFPRFKSTCRGSTMVIPRELDRLLVSNPRRLDGEAMDTLGCSPEFQHLGI